MQEKLSALHKISQLLNSYYFYYSQVISYKTVNENNQYANLYLEKEMATHSSVLAWENPMDRGALQATVHGIAKSRTQLSDFTFLICKMGG